MYILKQNHIKDPLKIINHSIHYLKAHQYPSHIKMTHQMKKFHSLTMKEEKRPLNESDLLSNNYHTKKSNCKIMNKGYQKNINHMPSHINMNPFTSIKHIANIKMNKRLYSTSLKPPNEANEEFRRVDSVTLQNINALIRASLEFISRQDFLSSTKIYYQMILQLDEIYSRGYFLPQNHWIDVQHVGALALQGLGSMKSLKESCRLFDLILQEYPLMYSVMLSRAKSMYQLGDYSNVIDVLNGYVFDHPEALELRAYSLYHLKQYRRAYKAFQTCDQLYPNINNRLKQIECAVRIKNKDDVLNMMEEALETIEKFMKSELNSETIKEFIYPAIHKINIKNVPYISIKTTQYNDHNKWLAFLNYLLHNSIPALQKVDLKLPVAKRTTSPSKKTVPYEIIG